jgi:hypothetical protein
VQQVLVPSGLERDRRRCGYLYMMTLHDLVPRHEPVEQVILLLRIRV